VRRDRPRIDQKKGPYPFFSSQRVKKGYGPFFVVAVLSAGCGKKGPPLPPLLHLPSPPADLTATRRGDRVTVDLTVPSANTDNTRPANVERVDVYGITASTQVSDEQLVRRGKKIGSLAVKAPRDPNDTVEPDESAADIEPPVGRGLDQGARATVDEQLAPAALVPVDAAAGDKHRPRVEENAEGPLLGPATRVLTRTYAGVGINTRGKHGPVSRRVDVPLVPAPPPPSTPALTYNETAITVTWTPADLSEGLLPSYPLGAETPTLAYNVYDVPPAAAASSGGSEIGQNPPAETRLTKAPTADLTFSDTIITFGRERCFAVRTVATMGPLSVESGEAPPKCVVLKDTFPPAAPKGLTGVASEGTISLIWDANTEKDLAGYLVLRGPAPDGSMMPLTPSPISATTFNDTVAAGVRYVYTVIAVDAAGNRSAPSNRFEEAAR
jgi:hypothetical protein